MKKFNNPIFTLLLVSLFFTSCNGQVKTASSQKKPDEQQSLSGIHTKLFKTQPSTPYDNTNCGLQDKAGNLWFGVAGGNINGQPQGQGVYRYDGKTFINFNVQNGLTSDCVRAMLEDTRGNIWFATNKGICYYNGKAIQQIPQSSTPTFQSAYSGNLNQPLINDAYSIMQDKKGILWFGTSEGVVCYDGNKFTNFLNNRTIINDSSLTLKNVQCMKEDKEGNIWFGSGPMAFEGLCLYNGKSLKKFNPKKQLWIRKITEDKNGHLLFSTRGAGTVTFDGANFNSILQPKELSNNLFPGLFIDSKGNSWYSSDYVKDNDITTGGLWMFDGTSFTEFTKESGLSNTSVINIFEDREGNIWLGTRNTGLYKYDGKKFTNYSE